MAGVFVPPGRQQFLDPVTAAPLSFGKLYHYVPGSSTPKTTYVDQALTIANSNPITLDGAGECTVWGTGLYRQVLQRADGTPVWDQITGFLGASGGNVQGPATSTPGHFALFASSDGAVLQDGGVPGALAFRSTIDSSFVSDFASASRAVIAAMLVAGANITLTPVGSTLVVAAGGGGGGGITGPGASVNNALVLWNGTTGAAVKDSGIAPSADILAFLAAANNGAARTSLGLGSLATASSITSASVSDFATAARAVTAAQLVAGANITITPSGATLVLASAGGGGLPVGYIGAWENGVTTGNTAATNVTNLNNLINTVNAAGGGMIYFNTPGPYQINGRITPKSNVDIFMADGAYFSWVGAAGGTIFETLSTDVMYGARLKITVNEGAAFSGTVFSVHSCINCELDFQGLGSQTASGVFVLLMADSSAGSSPYPGLGGSRNTAFNRFKFRHMGVCGYGMLSAGITSGFGGQAQVVTDNGFYDCQFADALFRGFKINEWFDSNTFYGNTYVGLGGANAIGFMVNEGHTNNGSVYNLRIEQFAADIFGALGGRIGVALFESKGIYFNSMLIGPSLEGGDFVASLCTSYYAEKLVNSGSTVTGLGLDTIYIHEKALTTGP